MTKIICRPLPVLLRQLRRRHSTLSPSKRYFGVESDILCRQPPFRRFCDRELFRQVSVWSATSLIDEGKNEQDTDINGLLRFLG